jgi:exoribonuclease R
MWSHARFTYTEVAAILANTRGPEADRRKDRVADLLNLHDAYRALLKARNQRGASTSRRRNADHLRRERPHRSASCRAGATTRTA